MGQWLRICLPMQGTQARSLGPEDSTCATQKDSIVLCFPSRRGLIPRVSLVCKPEIPVTPRDEY